MIGMSRRTTHDERNRRSFPLPFRSFIVPLASRLSFSLIYFFFFLPLAMNELNWYKTCFYFFFLTVWEKLKPNGYTHISMSFTKKWFKKMRNIGWLWAGRCNIHVMEHPQKVETMNIFSIRQSMMMGQPSLLRTDVENRSEVEHSVHAFRYRNHSGVQQRMRTMEVQGLSMHEDL